MSHSSCGVFRHTGVHEDFSWFSLVLVVLIVLVVASEPNREARTRSGFIYATSDWDLLRLKASGKVRRRYLGLFVYSRCHRSQFQWTFCHT